MRNARIQKRWRCVGIGNPCQKSKWPGSQCPMHSNGHENSCRFACVCVSKIYRASSSGNWVTKALQLGPQACNSLSGRRVGGEWPGIHPAVERLPPRKEQVGRPQKCGGPSSFQRASREGGDRFKGRATAQRSL